MKISDTHQWISNRLNNPEVLTNPEPFLGPNWETVLRWWLYAESLTEEQKDDLDRRWYDIDCDTRDRAWKLAYNATIEVIGEDNRRAVRAVTSHHHYYHTGSITHELIAMHLLLERGRPLTFVPLVSEFNKDHPHSENPLIDNSNLDISKEPIQTAAMTYSNTHQRLSNRLNNPEVLTNPEPFLGPNWETVLRWWLYYDSLTDEQKNESNRRYWDIDDDTRDRAKDLSCNVAIEVIGRNNTLAVWYASKFLVTITYELIAMHLLLERGHPLTFVPLVSEINSDRGYDLTFTPLVSEINNDGSHSENPLIDDSNLDISKETNQTTTMTYPKQLTWDQVAQKIASMTPKQRKKPALIHDISGGDQEIFIIIENDDGEFTNNVPLLFTDSGYGEEFVVEPRYIKPEYKDEYPDGLTLG